MPLLQGTPGHRARWRVRHALAITLLAVPAGNHSALLPLDDETRAYEIHLAARDLVHVVVEQHGLDVKLRLKDAAGQTIREVDSLNGGYGPEELIEIVPTAGTYRLEVVGPENATDGHYEVRELVHRPATADDREHVRADHAYHDALALLGKRRYQDAIAPLQDALVVWRRLKLHRMAAETLHELAAAHYYGPRETLLAADFADEAVLWFRALGDQRRLAVALQRSAFLWLVAGQPDLTAERCHEALPILEEIGDQSGVARMLSRLATAQRHHGQLQASLETYEKALVIAETAGQPRLEAMIQIDMGGLLLGLEQQEAAVSAYSRAFAIYEEAGDYGNAVLALNGIADGAIRQRTFTEAEEAINRALLFLEKDRRASIRAAVRYNQGRLRRASEDFDGAHEAFREAAQIYCQADNARQRAHTLMAWGFLHGLDGDPASALALYDEARSLYESQGERNMAAVSEVRAAEMLHDLWRPEEAWQRIAPALSEIEKLRFETDRGDLRMSFFGGRQDYYQIAIDILATLADKAPSAGYVDLAFEVNERRLANELLEARTISSQDDEDVDASLFADVRQLEERLRDTVDDPSEVIARLHYQQGEIRRQRLRTTSTPAPPAKASLASVRESLLDDSTRLLVYALGEPHSYLWSVSRRGQELYRLPPKSEIDLQVQRFRTRLRNGREYVGRRLSEILLGPVLPATEERLAIVADGVLHTVPFSALLQPDSGEYLVERHEVVMLPSATVLATLRNRPPTPPSDLVALFGDPVFSTEDPRIHGREDVTSEKESSLPEDLATAARQLRFEPQARLEESGVEVEEIAAMAGDRAKLVATGFDASRETFTTANLGEYSILHFATHAVLHAWPELAGLVLSLVGQDGASRDGFIRAFEIARLRLSAGLVVLSACETGNGELVGGEGPLSLARAFLRAGASRVVYSLWRVDDHATARLMTYFYEGHFGHSLPPAAALQAAQRKMLADPRTAKPRAWAGFVLQGDWQALSSDP